ncbi:MAG TPA: hypothetical protein VI821_00570 [Candidatus Paceibacterota bacterium]
MEVSIKVEDEIVAETAAMLSASRVKHYLIPEGVNADTRDLKEKLHAILTKYRTDAINQYKKLHGKLATDSLTKEERGNVEYPRITRDMYVNELTEENRKQLDLMYQQYAEEAAAINEDETRRYDERKLKAIEKWMKSKVNEPFAVELAQILVQKILVQKDGSQNDEKLKAIEKWMKSKVNEPFAVELAQILEQVTKPRYATRVPEVAADDLARDLKILQHNRMRFSLDVSTAASFAVSLIAEEMIQHAMLFIKDVKKEGDKTFSINKKHFVTEPERMRFYPLLRTVKTYREFENSIRDEKKRELENEIEETKNMIEATKILNSATKHAAKPAAAVAAVPAVIIGIDGMPMHAYVAPQYMMAPQIAVMPQIAPQQPDEEEVADGQNRFVHYISKIKAKLKKQLYPSVKISMAKDACEFCSDVVCDVIKMISKTIPPITACRNVRTVSIEIFKTAFRVMLIVAGMSDKDIDDVDHYVDEKMTIYNEYNESKKKESVPEEQPVQQIPIQQISMQPIQPVQLMPTMQLPTMQQPVQQPMQQQPMQMHLPTMHNMQLPTMQFQTIPTKVGVPVITPLKKK